MAAEFMNYQFQYNARSMITNLPLKGVEPHLWTFVVHTVVHFMFPHHLTPGQAVETEEIRASLIVLH